MILSDKDIKTKLDNGEIKISPMPDLKVALGTISIDLRLGKQFMIYANYSSTHIDTQDSATFQGLTELVTKQDGEPFIIQPRQFVLGSTSEIIELPSNLAG